MGIPNEAAPLPTAPPPGDGTVTFGGGGHQTFRGDISDGLYKGTIKEWKRVQSSFEGKVSEQFCFLFTIDGREGDGELAYYTGVKMSTHQKAKLPPFLDTMKLARPTPANPNLPNPVGAKAQLLVKNEPGKNDPTKKYPKIKEVLAA